MTANTLLRLRPWFILSDQKFYLPVLSQHEGKCQNKESGKYYFAIIMNIVLTLWTPWNVCRLLDAHGPYFENHSPNLCGLSCQSGNGSRQPRLSLFWPVSVCLLVIRRLVVSYALIDGWISGQAIVKSDFLIPWKRWNCLEYFGGLSRVKDQGSVCHRPVVCSPWWYSESQMLDPQWWCFGGSGRAQGRSRVWLLYV